MAKSELEVDEELSELFTSLWNEDKNACLPGEDYEVNLQGYVTSTRDTWRDRAGDNLFSWLNEDKVFDKPTFKAFRNLLDNYESETGKAEEVTQEEEEENKHFLDVIMETGVMKKAHDFLVGKGMSPEDPDEFKRQLYKIWFRVYRRLREDDSANSSGFEHVFVGETRGHDVIGFHNWIQFYLQEKRGHIDYRGYFRRGTANEDQPALVTLQFFWKNEVKPIGSSLIGTSPEFEIALYTVCFLLIGHGKVALKIQDYLLEILCHKHGKGIGSTYPISNI